MVERETKRPSVLIFPKELFDREKTEERNFSFPIIVIFRIPLFLFYFIIYIYFFFFIPVLIVDLSILAIQGLCALVLRTQLENIFARVIYLESSVPAPSPFRLCSLRFLPLDFQQQRNILHVPRCQMENFILRVLRYAQGLHAVYSNRNEYRRIVRHDSGTIVSWISKVFLCVSFLFLFFLSSDVRPPSTYYYYY